jgi:hypothetical protein
LIPVVLAIVAFARAAPSSGCTPATPEELQSQVAAEQQAILNDAAVEWDTTSARVEGHLSCASEPVDPRTWANHLLGASIVLYARNAAWQPPAATAFRIAPDIEVVVGATHPLATWRPTPATAGDPIPRGVQLYVDGTRASRFLTADDWHLLQRRARGHWEGLVLHAEPVPDDWRVASPWERRLQRRRTARIVGGVLGVAIGGGAATAFGLSAASRAAFYDPETPESRYEGLRQRSNTLQTVGIALAGGAGVTLGLTLGVPW